MIRWQQNNPVCWFSVLKHTICQVRTDHFYVLACEFEPCFLGAALLRPLFEHTISVIHPEIRDTVYHPHIQSYYQHSVPCHQSVDLTVLGYNFQYPDVALLVEEVFVFIEHVLESI